MRSIIVSNTRIPFRLVCSDNTQMLHFVQFSAGVFLNNKVIKITFILIKLGLNETFNNIETPFNTSKETYDNK